MVLATPARNWLGYAKASTNASDRRSIKKSCFFHSTPSSAANHTQTHAPVQKITTHNNSFFAFDFIHPGTPKSIAPRDQATNPSTLLRPPKKPSCPTKSFTTTPSPRLQPLPFRTRHRNHHAQQLIFCVSTSFTLIHLKTLLHATKPKIPLPSCDHPKSHPVPQKFHFPQRASLPPRPGSFNHCPSYPPSKPPCTTTCFLRFNFVHPDTPKSIAPRDQAKNPSTSYDHRKAILSHEISLPTKSFATTPLPPQLQPLPFVPAIETTTHNNSFFTFRLHSP